MKLLMSRDIQEKQVEASLALTSDPSRRAYLESLSLEGKPKLQHIGRQTHEVLGGVMAGGGIEAHRATALQHCTKCIRLY